MSYFSDNCNIESNFVPELNIKFRNFENSANQLSVESHYYHMRSKQTVEFVNQMHKKYSFTPGRIKMTINDAFSKLQNYVDASDPDISLPNIIHMLQTAEGIKQAGHPDWFQLVGLIHDMGKIMFLWGNETDGQNGTAEGQQWALGGDTWVVGCRIPDCVVFPEFNTLNPDMHNEDYNTEFGMYQPHCGLNNLRFAYGHDEYLYQMLIANYTSRTTTSTTPPIPTIPQEGLAMIRYHSAYPWHTGEAYRHFMLPEDYSLLSWVQEFNKFDLYTKDNKGSGAMTVKDLWPYYQTLIDKYLPGSLDW